MTSDAPKPGAVPGWGQPQPADPAAPVPPAQVPPAPAPGGVPGWGQAPVPPAQVPPPPAPVPPAQVPPPPAPGGVPGWGQAPVPPAQVPPAPAPGGVPGWGQAPVQPGPNAGPTPPPGGPPAGGWSPQPAAPSGSSGCLKIILILAAIGVILVTLLIVGLIFIGGQIASSVGVNSDGSIGQPCKIIDNGSLSSALGSKAEAIQLEGLYDATIGIILDKRVLPNAEDCWITADQSTALGRIARYQGGDAAAVFQAERQKAAPTSQDQGGGVSIDNSGYFGGDVSGLGDEAFCTGISTAIQAGVLVRKGDTLVYVSLSGPADGTPAMDTTPDGVVTAPSICATAQTVARAMLP